MIRSIGGGLYRIDKQGGKQVSTPLASAEQQAQAELDKAQAIQAEAQTEVSRLQGELNEYLQARTDHRARALADEQAADIDRTLADLPPLPEPLESAPVKVTPEIEHIHRQIAAAEQAVAEARTVLAGQQARVRELEQRQADLLQRRKAIQQERAQGVDSPDHGPQLALITADLGTLEPLLQEARGDLDSSAVQRANDQLTYLQGLLAHQAAEQKHAALLAQAKGCEQALVAVLAEVDSAGKRLGHMQLHQHWQPSDLLRKAVSYGWTPG